MHKLHLTRCKTAVALALSVVLALGSLPVTNVKAAGSTNKTATEVVKDMTVGWNIGNSLDALASQGGIPYDRSMETAWGNPTVTRELVEAVGKAGFNTIRIPVSWGQYTSGSDYTISSVWMKRVKEVVDYAIDNGMYVILNSHHDITSSEKNFYRPDKAHKSESEKYFKSIWTQIGKEFKDYDYHLVFETMNEPRLINHSEEWWFPRNNPSADIKEAVSCINDFNQVALDAIRATGGNNATRCVMVPGYDASIEGCMTDSFKLPTDSASNRIILSVHAYVPYYFALSSSPYETKFDNSTKGDIDSLFNDLNQKFLSKGTPVVIGETSATNRNNTAERDKWANYYWGAAEKYSNLAMVLWDNNNYDNPSGSDGECHRYIDRNSLQWKDPEIIEAIMSHVDGTPAKNNGGNQPQPTQPVETQPQPTEPQPTEPQPTQPQPTVPADKDVVTLKNVSFGKAIDLSANNYKKISKIVVKFKGSATEFNGSVVLGEWVQQNSFDHKSCSNKTFTVTVKNPQSTLTINKWWSNTTLEIDSIDLVY